MKSFKAPRRAAELVLKEDLEKNHKWQSSDEDEVEISYYSEDCEEEDFLEEELYYEPK